ncbi:MAG: hypothetical protein Q8P32_01400 [Candidatus Komeilibacteria bacterium]|nr:hypothetical protein [Candidatus Komeilibacteria bacterium]
MTVVILPEWNEDRIARKKWQQRVAAVQPFTCEYAVMTAIYGDLAAKQIQAVGQISDEMLGAISDPKFRQLVGGCLVRDNPESSAQERQLAEITLANLPTQRYNSESYFFGLLSDPPQPKNWEKFLLLYVDTPNGPCLLEVDWPKDRGQFLPQEKEMPLALRPFYKGGEITLQSVFKKIKSGNKVIIPNNQPLLPARIFVNILRFPNEAIPHLQT